MPKIGVFVCWCGGNIAATVDVKEAAKELRKEAGVVFAADYQYMCSEGGQAAVRNAIREHKLAGIAVCACSPRMHETTFRKTAAAAGLNPYMVEIANIREQCSWIHKKKPETTAKAIVLGRAAIAKLRLNVPLTARENEVVRRALVIGGGIAGLQTALDISDAGFRVDVVEKNPTIGGRMAQLDKTFPTLDCAACILTPKMVDSSRSENITLYTYSEIESVSGFVGDFTVRIRRKARYVDESLCSGCGDCMAKCPAKTAPSEFDQGLRKRGAIYIPFAQAIPNVPVIDRESCLKFKTGKCGLCRKICGAGAVNYDMEDAVVEERYGAIVAATGFETLSPSAFGEFHYDEYPDVITSLEFERLCNAAGPTGGHLTRPSDGREPKRVVFVQCVGSRGAAGCARPYCSKICCMYTAKHAMLVRDKYPDSEVYVFYIDVRTPGKSFDEFQRRAVERYGVHYVKGMVGQVEEMDGGLAVQASDLLSDRQMRIPADLVVLAMAIKPDAGARGLATMLTVGMDTNDFFTEAQPKLRPVESPTAGIFLSGVCQGPKDIPETVAQAGAAASKA
ncbi:MAG: CoB--CoM heterodisulfide reductase iron-sulfur subunit A family protein, partial [Planctomycetota bacterium]|nr:CoB--CoM heterodisulfide reductase iron-sulfur subunit A family protein [Planctomycetota bacterium]